MACDCVDLVGLKYRLGADGTDGYIDCIHLVYEVQRRCGVKMPAFDQAWYGASTSRVCREILQWGERVARPQYDGDMLLLREETWMFAVAWESGVLYINNQTGSVSWAPVSSFTNYHCFRMKGS